MGHSTGICQHGTGNTKNITGDDVDKSKRQHCCKCTAGTFFCPAAANGNCKQDVQVIDHSPANVLHGSTDGHNNCHICTCHLHQLTKADHQTGRRHNSDDLHQYFAQLLQEIKVNHTFFLRFLLCFGFPGRLSICSGCTGRLLFCIQCQNRCLTCFSSSACTMQLHIFCAACQNNRRNRFQPPLTNRVKIYFCYRLTFSDFVTLFNQNLKALAIKTDCFQTHMNQNFQPAICHKANGMFCSGNRFHRTVYRTAKQPVRRFNGDAFTQNTACKGFIRDFVQRNNVSAEGCCHNG